MPQVENGLWTQHDFTSLNEIPVISREFSSLDMFKKMERSEEDTIEGL